MKQRWILSLCGLFVVFCAVAQSGNYKEEREFYESSCTTCHEMRWYLWPRSYKSWELTAENMRTYVDDDTILSSADCQRIAEFLAQYADEGRIIVPEGVDYVDEDEEAEVLPPVKSESSPMAEVEAQKAEPIATEPVALAVVEASSDVPVVPEPKLVSPKRVPGRVAGRLLKRLWNPGRDALKVARGSGFLAVVCLIGLIASGFGRRKLKLNFRKLHVKFALGLFLALATHGLIYLFEYGTPNVVWYWFGFVGFLLLIVTEVQGIVRKHFRKGLLISHIAGGCAGLALSILHWVWAWL